MDERVRSQGSGLKLRRCAAAAVYLYFFLLAISIMACGFKTFKPAAEGLIKTASNPVIGLCVGLLATAVIQSSSCTTSIVVALCAEGIIKLEVAVPIIMGANIGTSVTNTLVSMGYFRIRSEYRRAVEAATVHDFFNILTVLALFPVEAATGIFSKAAMALAEAFYGVGSVAFMSPIAAATQPVTGAVDEGLRWWGTGESAAAAFMIGFGLLMLFAMLVLLTRTLKGYLIDRVAVVLDRVLGRSAYLGLVVGTVVTAIIQSSSVTTSLLVPLAASGVATLSQIYPITLGANIGTTVTALLASLAAGNVLALSAAFSHTLFNAAGVVIFFVITPLRAVPPALATLLGVICARRRYILPLYILVVIFVVPVAIIVLCRLLEG